jgi:murein DD-endopeptidase MepM/ murein hydrolase activator NlpD
MSKGLGIVIFIFIALVGINLLLNLGAILLPPLPGSAAAADSTFAAASPVQIDSSDDIPVIHVSLFTPTGAGISYVTQGYGVTPYSYLYPNDWHDGVDIGASYGEAVYSPVAASDATVIATGNQDNYCYHKGFGKYVAVRDPENNLVLWFAHLGNIDVTPGESIDKGTEIGTIGETGLETGAHLHFSIFEDTTGAPFTMQSRDGCGPEPTGQDVDPLNYLGSVYN